MLKTLQQEKERIEKKIAEIEKYIEKNKDFAMQNHIACSTSHKVPQYYLNGKYVSKKNLQKVKTIAQFNYYKKILLELQKRHMKILMLLEHYESDMIDDIFIRQCKGRQSLVYPIQEPKEIFIQNWLSVEYEPNNQWEDDKAQFITIMGEKVRSKAEKIIADELFSNSIPYRYEFPLELNVGNRTRTFRPDFLVLNPNTRKEYILEHLGLLDKVSYYNSNLNKIGIYEKNGYLLGRNLLILHETSEHPIDISILREYIEEYFS